jgi:hypothetical protein
MRHEPYQPGHLTESVCVRVLPAEAPDIKESIQVVQDMLVDDTIHFEECLQMMNDPASRLDTALVATARALTSSAIRYVSSALWLPQSAADWYSG